MTDKPCCCDLGVRLKGPGRGIDREGGVLGREMMQPRGGGAPGHLDVDQGIRPGQAVVRQQPVANLAQVAISVRLEAQKSGAARQPFEMGFQPKGASVVAADDFIEAVGEQEAAVVRRNRNLVFGKVLAVEISDRRHVELSPVVVITGA